MTDGRIEVPRWRGPVRYGFLIFAGAVLAWFAFAVSVDNVFGATRPGLGVRLGAGSDLVEGAAAAELLQPRITPEKIDEAYRLAEAAVRASPVNVRAIRVLGLVATLRNNGRAAQRLFAFAESLSRRDLPTQLWLIEQAVQRNDIPVALLHYNRALRTNVEARGLLFPVLSAAASDPAIARPLGRILAARPEWWSLFAATMIATPESSPRSLTFLLQQVRLNPADQIDRPVLDAALSRLVTDREYLNAHLLFLSVRPSRGAPPGVNDGGFETAPELPPFDWGFLEEADLSALREARENGYVLRLRSSQGRSGAVARQLLLLPAGQYRLSFVAGDVSANPASRPMVNLICASETPRQLVQLNATGGARGGQAAAAGFSVPAGGCAAQWLAINAGAATGEEQAVEPWIDQISIVPLTGPAAVQPGPGAVERRANAG
jgi:hypothetical protein